MEDSRGKRLLLILVFGIMYAFSEKLYCIFDTKSFELVIYLFKSRKWSVMKHLYDIVAYI